MFQNHIEGGLWGCGPPVQVQSLVLENMNFVPHSTLEENMLGLSPPFHQKGVETVFQQYIAPGFGDILSRAIPGPMQNYRSGITAIDLEWTDQGATVAGDQDSWMGFTEPPCPQIRIIANQCPCADQDSRLFTSELMGDQGG
jgi:hypothetical protein